MFEKFFGPKSPEQVEKVLEILASKEFEVGVNGPAVFNAFNAVRLENQKKVYGLTNNRLLNIVRDCAFTHVTSIEDIVMGGREGVIEKINLEINQLRESLPESERAF